MEYVSNFIFFLVQRLEYSVSTIWIGLLLVLLNVLSLGDTKAQSGCLSNDGTISIQSNNFNKEGGYTQSYALVNNNGIIQRIKDNSSDTQPLFVAVPSGDYVVYALNYKTDSGVNNYTIGNAFSTVSGTCLDISNALSYSVCLCSSDNCHSTDGVVSLNVSGNKQSEVFTQSYALTNTIGKILAINTNPSSLNNLFSDISVGQYLVYALSYETTSDINNYEVGNSIRSVIGNCLDMSLPICYNICEPTANCNSEDGTISINNRDFNQDLGFQQIYVLTNKNNLILQIKHAFTTPLFQTVTAGAYIIYAINYEESGGISGLQQGNHIRNITGGCLAISEGLAYNVCSKETNCNAPDGIIRFSSTSFNQSSEFRQVFVLTDENDAIIDIKNNAPFSNLSPGYYKVYALNYNQNEGISNLNIGQSIQAVNGTCIDKKGPLIYSVCEEICDNGIDDDGDGKIDCADSSCPEICPCDLKVTLTPSIYNDGNTPNDIADDTFTFTATITGSGNAGWEGGGQSGSYGTTVVFGPYPVDSEGVGFQIKDKINEKCFTSISSNMSSCVYLETCTCCVANN